MGTSLDGDVRLAFVDDYLIIAQNLSAFDGLPDEIRVRVFDIRTHEFTFLPPLPPDMSNFLVEGDKVIAWSNRGVPQIQVLDYSNKQTFPASPQPFIKSVKLPKSSVQQPPKGPTQVIHQPTQVILPLPSNRNHYQSVALFLNLFKNIERIVKLVWENLAIQFQRIYNGIRALTISGITF